MKFIVSVSSKELNNAYDEACKQTFKQWNICFDNDIEKFDEWAGDILGDFSGYLLEALHIDYVE